MAGHPTARVMSFTGSTAVGRSVASQAGDALALPALELAGNGPFVVTEDADIEAAARPAPSVPSAIRDGVYLD